MEHDYTYLYEKAMDDAEAAMLASEFLEPTSALKQAATDCGIPYGDEMGKFVTWALSHYG